MTGNIYLNAIHVQDASNFSGVALSFGRLIETLNNSRPAGVSPREYLATHPCVVLYMDKLMDMMGQQGVRQADYSRAYEECKRLSQGEVKRAAEKP